MRTRFQKWLLGFSHWKASTKELVCLGKDLCPEEQVQHLSCLGDEREETLVFNHKALYIYRPVCAVVLLNRGLCQTVALVQGTCPFF